MSRVELAHAGFEDYGWALVVIGIVVALKLAKRRRREHSQSRNQK